MTIGNLKYPPNPTSTKWLATQAIERQKAGKLEEAAEFYLEAIKLKSSQPAWLYENAIILLTRLQRWEAAMRLGERALILHSTAAEIHRALEILDRQPVDFTNSIAHYQQTIAFEPQQPAWLYYNLARQLWKSDRIPETIELAYQGCKKYPDFFPLFYLLGNALIKAKQPSKAKICYQRVQKLAPGWLEVEEKLNLIRDEEVAEVELEGLFLELEKGELSIAFCDRLWQSLKGQGIKLNYGCWLCPSILYLEATVDKLSLVGKKKIFAASDRNYGVARANFWQISPNRIAGIAVFAEDLCLTEGIAYRLCVNDNNIPVLILGAISQTAYGLESIDRWQNQPDAQKHLIRETLSSSLIELVGEKQKPAAAEIIKKLQYFLKIPVTNLVDPQLPFKIFIDYLIPLQTDGLFISGWLQDAYQMLEGITVISALGFSLELTREEIYLIDRQDVSQFLRNTRYGDFEGNFGFCAYARVPAKIRDSLEGIAELHSFRFLVKLQGDIKLEIVPDAKYGDFFNSRQKILQIAPPDKISSAMLENCIAPAALKLQQLCMKTVTIDEAIDLGTTKDKPLVSLIIPLYQRLDFIKIQLATMANDPALKHCEIIYILDSPEQKAELTNLLRHQTTLYQLPVKLVIMKHNSGYAAANNAGVDQARGDYLILLNSDVFPQTKGWIGKIIDFYQSSDKIGIVGTKLLYEDNSLQHAGMFFTQTTFPFWITLHYYKGLPEKYPPAQQTRAVPAVTGACLTISQELYQRVGGLSTDYIIGDFEDSDLCFKCRELGYESWYLADVSLYHLERQSVPLNITYNGSLAWQLNGRLHQQRWGKAINDLQPKI